MLAHFANTLLSSIPPVVLAEGTKLKSSMAWGLVLLCVILGMLVTVNPVKRDTEVKNRRD